MDYLAVGASIISAQASEQTSGFKKVLGMVHGISLLLLLVAGFGALAKLPGGGMGMWVIVKLVIWLGFGALPVFARKKPEMANTLIWLAIVLGGAAAYTALYKPF